jgi:hypothetical protein
MVVSGANARIHVKYLNAARVNNTNLSDGGPTDKYTGTHDQPGGLLHDALANCTLPYLELLGLCLCVSACVPLGRIAVHQNAMEQQHPDQDLCSCSKIALYTALLLPACLLRDLLTWCKELGCRAHQPVQCRYHTGSVSNVTHISLHSVMPCVYSVLRCGPYSSRYFAVVA